MAPAAAFDASDVAPITPYQGRLRAAVLILNLISVAFIILFLLCVALFRLKRHVVLLNVFVAFGLVHVFNVLVLFPLHRRALPSFALCLASQALSSAGLTCAALCCLSLVVMTWALLMERAQKYVLPPRYLHPILISLPWAGLVSIAVMGFITTGRHPEQLKEETFICIARNRYTRASHIIIVLAVTACVVFQTWCTILGYLTSRETRRAARRVLTVEPSVLSQVTTRVSLDRVSARIALFELNVIIAWVVAWFILFDHSQTLIAMYTAVLGTALFIVFAPNKDLLDAVRPSNLRGSLFRWSTASGMDAETLPAVSGSSSQDNVVKAAAQPAEMDFWSMLEDDPARGRHPNKGVAKLGYLDKAFKDVDSAEKASVSTG